MFTLDRYTWFTLTSFIALLKKAFKTLLSFNFFLVLIIREIKTITDLTECEVDFCWQYTRDNRVCQNKKCHRASRLLLSTTLMA